MRKEICQKCGEIFETLSKHKYFCPECTKAIKRDTVMRQRICAVCGQSFVGGPRALYCPSCRKTIYRERDKMYHKNGPKRTLGGIDKCILCHKEYVITGPLQKYCPACAKGAVSATVNAHKREYAVERAEYTELKRQRRAKQKELRKLVKK